MTDRGDRPFEFRLPGVVHVGAGSYARVEDEVARAGGRALLVTDPTVGATPRVAELIARLEGAGQIVGVFRDIPGEPTTTEVEGALAALRRTGAQSVLAVGGGSVIDTGKAVAVLATNPGGIADYKGANRVARPRLPLVVVNTTAGTGSEVTRFCIITDPATSVKMLIADPRLIPDAAVDDPLLTLTCPPLVTASTGLDALTHAIEAYVSARATPLSDLLALSAIRRIAGSLRAAFTDGADLAARTAMHLASLEAGMAFSNASVALVHGMARPVGAYFHTPHGLSNAVLLPHVMAWSVAGAPRRFAEIAAALGAATRGPDAAMAQAGVEVVRALCRDLEIPGLAGLGIEVDRLLALAPTMARDALESGSPGNNPRVPSADEIVDLYRAAL